MIQSLNEEMHNFIDTYFIMLIGLIKFSFHPVSNFWVPHISISMVLVATAQIQDSLLNDCSTILNKYMSLIDYWNTL